MIKLQIRKTVRIEEKIINEIFKIATDENKSENQVIENALKLYLDHHYMQHKATVINQDILKLTQSQLSLLENRINNKTNQLLSELAIQVSIQNQLMIDNLDVDLTYLDTYRKNAVDFIKVNQRILKLDDLHG